MKSDQHSYEIGGVIVQMTEGQAARWNNGNPDLDGVFVDIPHVIPSKATRITLRRAINKNLSPETAEAMIGKPAILVR